MSFILNVIALVEAVVALINQMKSDGSWTAFVAAVQALETEANSLQLKTVITQVESLFGKAPAAVTTPPVS